MEPRSIYQHLTGVFDTLLTVSIAPDLWDSVTLPSVPVSISRTASAVLPCLPASISLSLLKPGRKWCGGRLPGKGKGLPGKDWENGCMKAGKGGGGWPGLGGELSPVIEKGVGILGKSP